MTTHPAPRQATGLDRFFDTLRRSPVTRSHQSVIAGVCGGISERYGISTAVVRVGAVVLALLGPGVLLYLLAWLMLPDTSGRVRLEGAIRHGDGSSVTLLVITALVAIPDIGKNAEFGWLPLLVLGVLAVVGYQKGWFSRSGRERPADPTTPTTPPTAGPQDAPRS